MMRNTISHWESSFVNGHRVYIYKRNIKVWYTCMAILSNYVQRYAWQCLLVNLQSLRGSFKVIIP
jgi:hypothetical protein